LALGPNSMARHSPTGRATAQQPAGRACIGRHGAPPELLLAWLHNMLKPLMVAYPALRTAEGDPWKTAITSLAQQLNALPSFRRRALRYSFADLTKACRPRASTYRTWEPLHAGTSTYTTRAGISGPLWAISSVCSQPRAMLYVKVRCGFVASRALTKSTMRCRPRFREQLAACGGKSIIEIYPAKAA
jgi:hypothetical protein